MTNAFVHVELQTQDLAKAKEFYRELFAWKLEDVSMPQGYQYTMIHVGEGTGGGMIESMALRGLPPHWLPYVGVDDVAASTKAAKHLGAEILMDVTKVGDFGLMSVFKDPTGAVLALWQALKKSQSPTLESAASAVPTDAHRDSHSDSEKILVGSPAPVALA